MNILLVGAKGQVGFCLAKLLAEKKWNFLALDKSQLDITDAKAVNQIFGAFCPTIIINAAAYTAVDKAESEQELAFNINYAGAKNLAEAGRKIGAAIFHISTDYVFAGDFDDPYGERDPVAPQGIYGLSKLKGEQAVAEANPKHIILRTAWVFGEHGNNFVKTMIRLGRDRDQLGVVADQIGGPTYAGDIAGALLAMIERYELAKDLAWGIYHYSGYPYVNWYEFATAIFHEVANQHVYSKAPPNVKPITTAEYPTPAKRPFNSRLNCQKISKTFDIKPSDWQLALKNIKAYS